jgi:hypothetical protein
VKRLKLFLAGTLTLAGLSLVWAQTPPSATVTWVAPVTYVDTTKIVAGDLDHYTVSWSRTVGGTIAGSVDVKTLTALVPVACGTMQFSVTATTSATAAYPNTTSGPAGPVLFDSKAVCAPNPPSALAAH